MSESDRPERITKLSSQGIAAWDLFVTELRIAANYEIDSDEWLDSVAAAFERARDSGEMASLHTIRSLEADVARFDAAHVQSLRRDALKDRLIGVLKAEINRLRDAFTKAGR